MSKIYVCLADSLWNKETALSCDAIFLPGGMPGTKNLLAHEELGEALVEMKDAGKLICAICAAPIVLGKYMILDGKKAIQHPATIG